MKHTARIGLVAALLAALLAPAALAGGGEDVYEAARAGDAAKVKKLLDKGADPNYQSSDSYTPLLLAASNGHADICRMLIDAGADTSGDAGGWTALHLAADHGHADVVAVLLEAKVPVDVKLGDYTALDLAVRNGHQEVVDLLAAAGGGSDATAKSLFIAAEKGDLATVKQLAEAGADLEWERPKNHWTALHSAAYHGDLDVVTFLASKGANLDARESTGLSPLMLAAQQGKTEVIRALLDAGASIHHQDDHHLTAIHRAAQSGSPETVLLLLERGAKLDADAEGNTPMLIAAGEGDAALVKIFIEKGADVNHLTNLSALHKAAYVGSVEVAEILLAHGANPNVASPLGKTPLQAAIDMENDDVAELLRKHGAKK